MLASLPCVACRRRSRRCLRLLHPGSLTLTTASVFSIVPWQYLDYHDSVPASACDNVTKASCISGNAESKDRSHRPRELCPRACFLPAKTYRCHVAHIYLPPGRSTQDIGIFLGLTWFCFLLTESMRARCSRSNLLLSTWAGVSTAPLSTCIICPHQRANRHSEAVSRASKYSSRGRYGPITVRQREPYSRILAASYSPTNLHCH